MKKILTTLMMLCTLTAVAVAQTDEPDAADETALASETASDTIPDTAAVREFRYNVAIGSGLSGYFVTDDGAAGSLELGATSGIDLGVSFFFSKHWGVHAGVGFTASRGSYLYDNLLGSTSLNLSGHDLDYATELVNPRYDIQDYLLTVPLQVAFRCTHWYVNFGAKLAVSLASTAHFSIEKADVSCTDHTTGVQFDALSPSAANMGCAATGMQKLSQDKCFGNDFRVLLALETGYRIETSPLCAWTIGLYGEYALTNYALAGDGFMMVAQDNGTVAQSLSPLPVGSLNNFNAGLRITCDFGFPKSQKMTLN